MRSRLALSFMLHALCACASTVEFAVDGRGPERTSLEPHVLEILESARESIEAGDARGASDDGSAPA